LIRLPRNQAGLFGLASQDSPQDGLPDLRPGGARGRLNRRAKGDFARRHALAPATGRFAEKPAERPPREPSNPPAGGSAGVLD
jgi:hypothetical protein